MLDVLRRAMNNLRVSGRSHPVAAESSREDAGHKSSELQVGNAVSGTELVDASLIANFQRQQKLADLYLFALDSCLRNGRAQWWRQAVSLPFVDMAQGVEHLKELCLQQLLYDAGDIAVFSKVYEILEEEGHFGNDDPGQYLLELLRFVRPRLKQGELLFFRDLKRYWITKKQEPPAVVSVVLPDEQSISSFQELCLPSLESERGLTLLLAQYDVTLLLFVHQRRLAEIEEYLKQKEFACAIICEPIPEDLCAVSQSSIGEVRRDWLVGVLQYLHLMEARRRGADFYAINPKAIYASGFFNEVMRIAKGKSAILSSAIWLNNRGLLDRHLVLNKEDGSLTISPVDLTTTGLQVSASTRCATFVEGFVSVRGATAHLRVTWAGEEHIDIHSTSYEIVFLAAKSLRRMPRRFFIRPSAEMDRILRADAAVHFVTEEDGIAIGEFGHPPGGFADIGEDRSRFDAVVGRLARPRQAEFFKRPVRLAISRNDDQECSGTDIGQSADLLGAFLASFEQASGREIPRTDQVLGALNVMHQYEMSEYGLENMAGAIKEGRRLLDLPQGTGSDLDETERKELIRSAMNFDHVDRAIALAKEGRESTSFIHEFLVKMMELRVANARQARLLRRRFPMRSFAVIGSIAWGEAFVDKFMDYHVPSLLAAGNIPALARKKKVIHSIVTTEADRKRIVAHPVFKRLSQCVEVVFTCFPKEFLEQRERNQYNFYYFYGLLDHQSVFLATALRAELYLLPVDTVYSTESLTNLSRHLRQDADCCSVAGIECDPAELRAWLDDRPRDEAGALELPAGDLLSAAVGRPDAYCRSLVMGPENRSFCRYPRELIWPMADGLAIHSIFMHPVAVSARLMSRPFYPQYENVDFALLPRLLQGDGTLKVLQDASEVSVAQFGAPAAREEFLESGFSLEAFIEAHQYDYAAQRRCFPTRQFFPCKGPPYLPSANHDSEVALIQAALKRYRFRVEGGKDH
jgi:hypothetical protein